MEIMAFVAYCYVGLHLEGPFINKEKKGAHDIECITDISNGIQGVTDIYGSLDNVSIVTLAPELPGALEVTKALTKRGITVSLGISLCVLLCMSISLFNFSFYFE